MNQKLWNKDFILMAIGNLFMAMGFYFLIPTLPIYVVDHLGAEKHEVGYILAAYTVSALIIRPITGIAIDIYGRKWIYIISFLLFTLLLSLYPFMTTFLMLLILRFIHGFAWGINTTSGATAVVDIIPTNKRGRGLGYFGVSFTASMAGLGSGILMPTLQAMVNNIVTIDKRGLANATLITAFDLGIGAGSLLLGFLAEMIGFRYMFLFCCGVLALALIYYQMFVNRYYHLQRVRMLRLFPE